MMIFIRSLCLKVCDIKVDEGEMLGAKRPAVAEKYLLILSK